MPQKKGLSSPQRAHLMMRYHAPLRDFDRGLKWIRQICRRASVGEVMFIIDPEEYYFGFPTLKHLRAWAKKLKAAGEILR